MSDVYETVAWGPRDDRSVSHLRLRFNHDGLRVRLTLCGCLPDFRTEVFSILQGDHLDVDRLCQNCRSIYERDTSQDRPAAVHSRSVSALAEVRAELAQSETAWHPDWATAPGEILRECLEERGMTQTQLARDMGRPLAAINEIINGKKGVTPETALQLEAALGINALFWVRLEGMYRLALARRKRGQ